MVIAHKQKTFSRDHTSKSAPQRKTPPSPASLATIRRMLSQSGSRSLTPDAVLSLQRTIGNYATHCLLKQTAPDSVQRVTLSESEQTTLLTTWVTEKGLARETYDAILKENQEDAEKYKTKEDLEAALQSALEQQAGEVEEEPQGVSLSTFIKQFGFTHVAHFVGNANFDLIMKSGKLDTPEVTGKSNFDFDEYNNESQIFLGLVNENDLSPLYHYGSLVYLFDLSLLDGREDFFINSMFTGKYVHETGARYGDDGDHFAEILETIVKNGGRNEVVFQSAINFSSEPLAKIVVKSGNKELYRRMIAHYNLKFASYNLTAKATSEGIVLTRA